MKFSNLLFLLSAFFILLLFSNDTIAQRKKSPRKVDSPSREVRKAPPKPSRPIKIDTPSTRNEIKPPKPIRSKTERAKNLPNKPTRETRREVINDARPQSGRSTYHDNKPERPPRRPTQQRHPETRKPSPVRHTMPAPDYYEEEYYEEEQSFQCIVLHPVEYYYEVTVMYDFIDVYYPIFPLELIDARFYPIEVEDVPKDYLEKRKIDLSTNEYLEFYDVEITVKTKSSKPCDTFGVMIENEQDENQLVLFNERQKCLKRRKEYTLYEVVALTNPDTVYLTLGYYDSKVELFYPADTDDENTFMIYEYFHQNPVKL